MTTIKTRTKKAHWIPVVAGFLKKGDLVLMLGSGGGLSMAALAMEWGYDT